jgi:hypothetical protein
MSIENKQNLVAAVRDHALANYENGGWDDVVEAWSDDEIIEEMGDATTIEAAIANVSVAVKLHFDYAEDIRSTAF